MTLPRPRSPRRKRRGQCTDFPLQQKSGDSIPILSLRPKALHRKNWYTVPVFLCVLGTDARSPSFPAVSPCAPGSRHRIVPPICGGEDHGQAATDTGGETLPLGTALGGGPRFRDTAAGLAYAHEKRLLHRDVKPENILIYADGRAALADFGASRFSKGVTRAYTEAGTLGYMAPEQAYGRVRFASDVFSLGLIAYEVLTGVLPMWPFEWPPERFEHFLLKVPDPVQAVLRKAAEFDPKRRYRDAVELPTALVAFGRVGG